MISQEEKAIKCVNDVIEDSDAPDYAFTPEVKQVVLTAYLLGYENGYDEGVSEE